MLGAGIGSYYQACISIAQITVGKEKVFTAITFIAASKPLPTPHNGDKTAAVTKPKLTVIKVQSLGVVLALGLSGAIFVNVALRDLRRVLPDASSKQLSGSLTGGSEMFSSLSPEQQTSALQAVVTASSGTFAFIMASAALSFVLSWFLRWEKIF